MFSVFIFTQLNEWNNTKSFTMETSEGWVQQRAEVKWLSCSLNTSHVSNCTNEHVVVSPFYKIKKIIFFNACLLAFNKMSVGCCCYFHSQIAFTSRKQFRRWRHSLSSDLLKEQKTSSSQKSDGKIIQFPLFFWFIDITMCRFTFSDQ